MNLSSYEILRWLLFGTIMIISIGAIIIKYTKKPHESKESRRERIEQLRYAIHNDPTLSVRQKTHLTHLIDSQVEEELVLVRLNNYRLNIKNRAILESNFGMDEAEKLVEGKIWAGMTEQQLIIALGQPLNKRSKGAVTIYSYSGLKEEQLVNLTVEKGRLMKELA